MRLSLRSRALGLRDKQRRSIRAIGASPAAVSQKAEDIEVLFARGVGDGHAALGEEIAAL